MNIGDLRAKREAFLLDTLDYYTVDPIVRRCVPNEIGRCRYTPEALGKTLEQSEGCAIGRKIPRELAIEFDAKNYSGVFEGKVFCLLPEELQTLGRDFLTSIQQLHDDEFYWTPKSLSRFGVMKLRDIIDYYKLEANKFQKYLTTYQ
jgi:hypothetical protein